MEHFHLTELNQCNLRTKYFQVDFVLKINFKFLYVFLQTHFQMSGFSSKINVIFTTKFCTAHLDNCPNPPKNSTFLCGLSPVFSQLHIFLRHYFFTCALTDGRVVHMQMWLLSSKLVSRVQMCPWSLGISLGATGPCSHCLGGRRHQNQWVQEKGFIVPADSKFFCLAKRIYFFIFLVFHKGHLCSSTNYLCPRSFPDVCWFSLLMQNEDSRATVRK